MRRILLTAVLAVAGALGTATAASADIGDITEFGVDIDDAEGTAELAKVDGQIRCTTGIEYGLVVKVTQEDDDVSRNPAPNPPAETVDANVEGVGAFGPNAGNEANSPCSTSLQSWEVVVARNRDSGTFQNGEIGVFALAGTSAENGDRGPGPFIGDSEYSDADPDYERTDP